MPETLKVACPKCKTVMQLSADLRGKKVKCPTCAVVIAIPAAKAAPGKAPAKTPAHAGTPPPQEDKAPIPLKRAGDDDEWGVIDSYAVERTEDKLICPFCAHDLEDDQVVCLNCGYDLIKRDRHGARVLHGTTGFEYFIWWLPAIVCLIILGGCITMIVMMIMGSPDFGAMNWLQRKHLPDHPKWGYVYGSVFFGFIGFLAARYAVKRLVFNPHPPEREKHLGKEEESDED